MTREKGLLAPVGCFPACIPSLLFLMARRKVVEEIKWQVPRKCMLWCIELVTIKADRPKQFPHNNNEMLVSLIAVGLSVLVAVCVEAHSPIIIGR